MPYYKPQHETFIRALIRHGDQLLAYQQAYPNATTESAYTAAIRLLAKPHIQVRVAEAMQQHRQHEQQRQQQREERRKQLQEEDTQRRRIWLAKVIRGQVERKRYINMRGGAVLVRETLNPFITLAAIELDTKYECHYTHKILLDRQFDRLYARATRIAGLAAVPRLNNQPGKKATTKQPISEITKSNKSAVQTSPNQPNQSNQVNPRFRPEKKPQTPTKKLTDSPQNPHPPTHTACNTNYICNKPKTPYPMPTQSVKSG